MRSLNCLKSNALVASVLLLTISLPAQAAKLAVVDLVRIYQEYSLVDEANEAISDGEEALKRVITTAESEMKKLETKTDAESEKRKDEIQSAVDDEVEEIHDLKENYNMKINRNIQDSVDKLALAKGYMAVLDKSFTVFAAEDITSELLTELEKLKTKK